MVILDDQYLQTINRNSSKGNQLKWNKDQCWYKADYTGYEGLAEYLISHLLKRSTLTDAEFVLYDTDNIKYGTRVMHGCKSIDFLHPGEQLITLERLYKNYCSGSLMYDTWGISGAKERISFLVDSVFRLTGISDFGIYLSKMLAIDAFFLNEDRHMHNIAVIIREDKSFGLCPFFDHGAGIMSDTTLDYPMDGDMELMLRKVKAKTICTDFDEALDAAESLYGCNLKFDFDLLYIRKLIEEEELYGDDEKKRVWDILLNQYRKYRYLFAGK